ncbi:hypothetical protein BDK51DRAFT_34390 [Blyttiomyces helicus]|uniref:Uncharacterized protein n=1 Tax=Blyttiomyces helicus TaxID=388810 RepID=A0A4P9WP73_9FUNG|nr:hypothetical protein BDK51DRAFT_34390 [Blyttiomyces helicus]|eukprot:RKO93913.1 hypothetical protein BDK51DRAFT_34390 [Blyttiomyces helicus]
MDVDSDKESEETRDDSEDGNEDSQDSKEEDEDDDYHDGTSTTYTTSTIAPTTKMIAPTTSIPNTPISEICWQRGGPKEDKDEWEEAAGDQHQTEDADHLANRNGGCGGADTDDEVDMDGDRKQPPGALRSCPDVEKDLPWVLAKAMKRHFTRAGFTELKNIRLFLDIPNSALRSSDLARIPADPHGLKHQSMRATQDTKLHLSTVCVFATEKDVRDCGQYCHEADGLSHKVCADNWWDMSLWETQKEWKRQQDKTIADGITVHFWNFLLVSDAFSHYRWLKPSLNVSTATAYLMRRNRSCQVRKPISKPNYSHFVQPASIIGRKSSRMEQSEEEAMRPFARISDGMAREGCCLVAFNLISDARDVANQEDCWRILAARDMGKRCQRGEESNSGGVVEHYCKSIHLVSDMVAPKRERVWVRRL